MGRWRKPGRGARGVAAERRAGERALEWRASTKDFLWRAGRCTSGVSEAGAG